MKNLLNISKTLVFSFLVLCLVTACSEHEPELNVVKTTHADVDPFIIALLPEQNVFLQKKRYKLLAEYLSKATGMNVKTRLLDSYDAVYKEMLEKKIDAAFFGSLSFVAMDSRIALVPIARPCQENGVSTYKGVIFARKDAGITKDIGTWKGKRIALVSKSTTAGYIFPRWYLATQGVGSFEDYFGKVIYAGSHDAAILAVFRGDADLGSAKDMIFDRMLEKNPSLGESLIVLSTSTPVPSNTLGIRGDIEKEIQDTLKKVLLAMDKTEDGRKVLSFFGSSCFIETAKTEYGPLREMLDALRLKPDYFALDAIGRNMRTSATQDER